MRKLGQGHGDRLPLVPHGSAQSSPFSTLCSSCWALDREGWWSEYQGIDGDWGQPECHEPWDSVYPTRPSQKRVEKTNTLHEARALVAMLENLKKHVQEAIQGRKEVKVTFKAWLAICDESEVIMQAKKLLEQDLRQSFKTDVAA